MDAADDACKHLVLSTTSKSCLGLDPAEDLCKRLLINCMHVPRRCNLREILHEYSMKRSLLVQDIIKAMARVLGLEENYFVNQLGDQDRTYARFHYYTPCSRPDLVYGIKPHTDGGLITIVLQDPEVEGLQVLKDGQWVKVPIVPYALLINVGDQTEIMSNGIFKSPIRRVLTISERENLFGYVLRIRKCDRD